jgi:hypothetical protein
MKRLPVAVQALHRFWVSNHPWPNNPSKKWKTDRNLALHAVDLIIWECKVPLSHPFCCDALNQWVRDLIVKVAQGVKVAHFPGFPIIRVPRSDPDPDE